MAKLTPGPETPEARPASPPQLDKPLTERFCFSVFLKVRTAAEVLELLDNRRQAMRDLAVRVERLRSLRQSTSAHGPRELLWLAGRAYLARETVQLAERGLDMPDPAKRASLRTSIAKLKAAEERLAAQPNMYPFRSIAAQIGVSPWTVLIVALAIADSTALAAELQRQV